MIISDVCKAKLMNLIAKTLRSKRGLLHLTQEDGAFLMGRSPNCIQNLERKKNLPDFETYFLLDEALQLSDDESVSLFLEIRACVRADRERHRGTAGTKHVAARLWAGK